MAENVISITVKADADHRSLDKATSALGNSIKRIGETAVGFLTGTVLMEGGRALAGFFAGAIKGAEESRKVTAQTSAVIASMGNAANVTAEQVGDLSTALSNQTGIDDELIQSGQNMLLTFGNIRNGVGENEKMFDRATKATLDMSVAMGQDMTQSAVQVGKALNDPIAGLTALSRVGIQFTDEQKDLITTMVEAGDVMGAQGIILGELERQFGGSAEAQATASDRLSTAWGNLQETLGEMLLPHFERLVNWIIEQGIPWFQNLATTVEEHVTPKLNAVVTWINESFLPAAGDFIAFIKDEMVPRWQDIAGAINEEVVPAIQGLMDKLGELVDSIIPTNEKADESNEKLGTLKDAVRLLTDAIGFYVPIQAGMTRALSDLIGGLMLTWTWTREAAGAIKGPLADAFGAIQRAASAAYDWINRLIDSIKRIPTSLPGWAGGGGGGVGGLVGAVVNPIGTIIGKGPFAHGGITGAATGGLHGGWRLMGEHGPELARVPSGTMVHSAGDTRGRMGGSGGGGLVIHNYIMLDGEQVAESVREVVRLQGGGDVQAALGWSR